MGRQKFKHIDVPEDMKFSNISSETIRTYHYPEGDRVIHEPVALHVSKSGTHRLIDSRGKSHIMPIGWLEIEFDAMPHFVI